MGKDCSGCLNENVPEALGLNTWSPASRSVRGLEVRLCWRKYAARGGLCGFSTMNYTTLALFAWCLWSKIMSPQLPACAAVPSLSRHGLYPGTIS